jgi:hypothetical protein
MKICAGKSFYFLMILLSVLSADLHAQKLFIHFQNKAGNKILQSDSVYQNAFEETFSIRNFKYYISNIILKSDGKTQSFPDKYFLVDNADTSSQQIELNTSLKNISSIQFLLGVDSINNVSGVQTGALDPAKGMFWTWNTGYVMAKLEGNSPVAHMPQHAFSYHVGGYKSNENVTREIVLQLPQALQCTKDCNITIDADVLKWFNGVHEIKISETPFCHEPGTLATKLADNYANMFSIESVK